MIFGSTLYNDITEAMINDGKGIQQRLNNPNMEPLWRIVLQRELDQISEFLGAIKGDLNSKSLLQLAEVAKKVDHIVFRGYTTPELGKTPAQSLIKKMQTICKQVEEVERTQPSVNYIALPNDQQKIESTAVDDMINYTAIREANKNNRGQFLRDYDRGLCLIEGKNLSHLNRAQADQHVRDFLGIIEPYPQSIQDPTKALQHQLIINTGQEVMEPFTLDVNSNFKIGNQPAGFFTDCKASSFNWTKQDGKICLEVQYETKVLRLIDKEGQVVVKNLQGKLEKKDMEVDLDLPSRPPLVVHRYQAEIEVVLGQKPEARLNTSSYSVRCDPAVEYKPDMKNYHQVTSAEVVVISKNK